MSQDSGEGQNHKTVVRDKVTRKYAQTTTFQEKGEPKRIQTKVPLPNAVKIVTLFFF